jgi:hypothetical protein
VPYSRFLRSVTQPKIVTPGVLQHSKPLSELSTHPSVRQLRYRHHRMKQMIQEARLDPITRPHNQYALNCVSRKALFNMRPDKAEKLRANWKKFQLPTCPHKLLSLEETAGGHLTENYVCNRCGEISLESRSSYKVPVR